MAAAPTEREPSVNLSPTRKARGEAPGWCRAELIAATVAALCFVSILPNDFCYDDNPVIRDSAKVNEPGQWLAIWTTDYWSQTRDEAPHRDLLYRPVAVGVFRLMRIVTGLHPLPYHVLSIALHALIAATVVRVCRRGGAPPVAGLAAGVLFAVLPIHTEAVASAVGIADLTATFMVLAAALLHGGSLGRTGAGGRGLRRTAAALAAFLAMGAKESGIVAVPLVAMWDALAYSGSSKPVETRRWLSASTVGRLIYLAVPLLAYVALRHHALGGQLHQAPAPTKTVNVLVDAPPWQHAMGVVQLWGMYWAKTFYPRELCINYAINAVRLATSVLDVHVLIGIGAVIALPAAVVTAGRKGVRLLVFAVAAVVLCYLPTSNAFVLMQVFFAERAWYLPSVWAAVLVGFAAAAILRLAVWRAVAILVVLAMGLRCGVRNVEWRNNATLYAAAHRDHPDSVLALHLYGQWLVQNGHYDQGVELLQRALGIDAGFTDAHRTLGLAHLQAGNASDALRHLQIAAMQVPGHPPTDAALARAAAKVSSMDAGELERLRRRAEAELDDADARLAVIRMLRDLGRPGEALEELRRHDDRFGSRADWQGEYAATLVYLNRRDEAVDRYRTAARLAPGDAQIAVEMAMLLLERRQGSDLDEAWRLAEQAERVAPGQPFVLVCRAELQAQRGDIAGAVATYQRAISALPERSPRRRAMEERAKALGG